MKFPTACLLLLIPFLTFSQIGTKTQQGKIYGVWRNNDFGYQMTLLLNGNGTGEFDGETIKFSTEGSTLAITQQGATTTYSFILQGNTLTLSGGDLDSSLTFKRGGDSEVNKSGGQLSESLSVDNVSKDLIGTWSGNGEILEFKSNNQLVYQGQTFPYSLSGNHIVIQTAQGNAMMPYTMSGNQLSLTVNGQTYTYHRGNSSVTNSRSGPTMGKGKIAPELVGKWCYVKVTTTNTGGVSSDECLTLKADGTYEYYSERSMSANTDAFWAGTNSQNADTGTWSYDGTRIYYNSATKGSGSYVLEKRNHPKNGDPMIVLDGYTYVTFYQKSPW